MSTVGSMSRIFGLIRALVCVMLAALCLSACEDTPSRSIAYGQSAAAAKAQRVEKCRDMYQTLSDPSLTRAQNREIRKKVAWAGCATSVPLMP
jgi:hypothetical protein